jgi:hypothetical protein
MDKAGMKEFILCLHYTNNIQHLHKVQEKYEISIIHKIDWRSSCEVLSSMI